VKVPPLQIISVLGVTNGFGFIVTVTVNGNPVHELVLGVTV
jgi:hypothetical protein